MKLRIIPTNEYEIHTGLPRSEVYQRLDDVVAEGGFGPRTRGKYFKGEVTKEGFCISPLLESPGFHYNSFLPIVKGSYREEGDEVILSIQTSLSRVINAFFLFFLCVCVLIMGSGTYLFFTTGTSGELIFLGVLFLLFLFVMTYLGFYVEDRKTCNMLLRLFEDTGDVLTNRPVCWHYGVNGEIKVKKRKFDNTPNTLFILCVVCVISVVVAYIDNDIKFMDTGDKWSFVFICILVAFGFFFCVVLWREISLINLVLKKSFLELKLKKQTYCVAYSDIKEVVYVWHPGIQEAPFSERGLDPKNFSGIEHGLPRNWKPHYDLIGWNDELLCSIDVTELFKKADFEDKMLYKGLTVKGDKGYFQLKRDTLKGEEIDFLRRNPVEAVSAQKLQKYIVFYNQRVLEKNRWFGSFTKDKRPIMEMTDTYEAGFVYWTTRVQDAIVYCKDGEMVREDIAQYIEVDWPENNSIVYYIKNVDKDVIIIIKND